MPFTFAHPAAILPLEKCRQTYFSALILGSLSPDFLYFLGGRAAFGWGHTFWGMLLINLPLCFIFYLLYRLFWRESLYQYLPKCINPLSTVPRLPEKPSLKWVGIFSLSAFIGMLSHIFWDAFTHSTGYFVAHSQLLNQTILTLPVYKWLQYGSGIIGLILCMLWIYRKAKQTPDSSSKTSQEKWRFWQICAVLTCLFIIIWQMVQPISLSAVTTIIIRLTDCLILALSILSVRHRFQTA